MDDEFDLEFKGWGGIDQGGEGVERRPQEVATEAKKLKKEVLWSSRELTAHPTVHVCLQFASFVVS